MYKSLYFKIILILVIFIIIVMSVVGTVLLNIISSYYAEEFITQMDKNFASDTQLYGALVSALDSEEYWVEQKAFLNSYSNLLGIDDYRNYYILDMNGNLLDGSDRELGVKLQKTPNMLSAMNGKNENSEYFSSEYADYALYLSSGERECIIYIKDSQDEMQQFSWIMFSIILQTLFIGFIIAFVLAFFLSKAITSPIQNLTKGAQLIAAGEFSHQIDVHSKDEIGTLTDTFNHMKNVLKNTIEEVSGERRKLETVFSHLKDGVIVFSDEGKVININESAKTLLLGKYDENFNMLTLLDVLSIKYEDESAEDDGVIHDIVFENRVFDVNFGNIRYMDDNKLHDGIIAVIQDITNRYELDKSRREFVANVSHELRTPLTSIKGACETIYENPDMPDEMKNSFLTMAIEESDRMTHIVRDLLVLSRLDNNRTQWNVSEFDMGAVLLHVCTVMQVEASIRKHEFEFASEPVPTVISADKERIEQVIINIISNAFKYTPDEGKISVRMEPAAEHVSIKVRDNGIGVPKEDIPRLFERFYRVEKARTSDTGGTGLGLAIAKEIVEAHGGTITIKSKQNVGTEVTIILPRKTKLQSTT